MRKSGSTVWVVMHYEFMGWPEYRIDSVQFHVSSSLGKAEEYIRIMQVDSHSWWQVHPHAVDAIGLDEGEEVHFYSHRGTRLKAAPWARARAAFLKYVAQHPESFPSSAPKAK